MTKVCIVGNGGSALDSKKGREVDDCDVVIRMGMCPLKGYGDHVGTKTSIYSTGLSYKKFYDTKKAGLFELSKEVWSFVPVGPVPNGITKWEQDFVKDWEQSSRDYLNKAETGLCGESVVSIDYSKALEVVRDLGLTGMNNNMGEFLRPSLGFFTVYKSMMEFSGSCISLLGFDFFNSGWYWDLTHKCNHKHSPFLEKVWINTKISEGSLKWL